jgi:hypothetical protein
VIFYKLSFLREPSHDITVIRVITTLSLTTSALIPGIFGVIKKKSKSFVEFECPAPSPALWFIFYD